MSSLSDLKAAVDPSDEYFLRDLIRFGVMADDQIARRYGDLEFSSFRLEQLWKARLVALWYEPLEGARIYSPSPGTRRVVHVPAARLRTVYESHLAHDIAVVDLADYLEQSGRGLRFVAESEIRAFLEQIGPSPRHIRGDTRHRPDGVLVDGSQRIAIELEHSDKGEIRYTDIAAWFVREWRVDSVRWYVDRPRIIERLHQVNQEHGFDRELEVQLLEFPGGVRIRKRRGRYVPWPG